jgi:hypothetical protein
MRLRCSVVVVVVVVGFADVLIFLAIVVLKQFQFSRPPKYFATWKVKYSNSALASHNTPTTSPPLASLTALEQSRRVV